MSIRRLSAQGLSSKKWGSAIVSDPYYSSVVALLHGNGTNNSTTITDSSSTATNWTAFGNAKISTSTQKYGTGSIAFDGSGDYIQNAASTTLFAFGTGDFTIEFWVYLNGTGNQSFYDSRPPNSSPLSASVFYESNAVGFYDGTAYRITGGSLTTSTWYHIAVSRVSGSTRLFINGTQSGSTYSDSNNYTCGSSRPVMGALGYDVSLFNLNGFMDDIRVTKGVGRYAANFIAPTQQFVDM